MVSPSTESTDHREKLAAYKRIPGLKACLTADAERMRVERHFRDEEGAWLRADLVKKDVSRSRARGCP